MSRSPPRSPPPDLTVLLRVGIFQARPGRHVQTSGDAPSWRSSRCHREETDGLDAYAGGDALADRLGSYDQIMGDGLYDLKAMLAHPQWIDGTRRRE